MAELLGRRDECEALDRLVADVLAGSSRVLVLRDAGVGKSALLAYLSGLYSLAQVASAVGVESEMDLPYSGMDQLCWRPGRSPWVEIKPDSGSVARANANRRAWAVVDRLRSAASMACGHGGLVHGPGGITAREAGAGWPPGRNTRMPAATATRATSEAE